MAIFNITYETENYYTKPVRQAVLELMVLPENSSDQKCLSFDIQNSLDARVHFSETLYGARLIRFTIPRKFCFFKVTVKATVEKQDINPFDKIDLSSISNVNLLDDDDFKIDHFRNLSVNEFTAPVREVLPGETIRLKREDLFQYMQRMTAWVYSTVIYPTGVTTTHTKFDEILQLKAGVCQDHAHLFIGIMRANGIPARYVSGYLSQGHEFNGDSAMHAWAEAFLPGSGWIGFDPSNNLMANMNYIKAGHGLDYTDCMPIRGILVAKGNGSTEYSVKVIEQQTQ
jgi:transglutaminase-like putative cysteine protease